ncbi:MAG: Mut7-C RNAse domain-containing protein [Deltaproteobacteria bacterium]|nr:Mut7-C RNAse domain-containing protein [Deltaproteobacteria bacterium]MBW2307790.1 Mut7-C RNAse domain-containing protein [Deltaproteobacteria bacterium]
MRFLLDRTLGRLAKWLRILGYDAAVDSCLNELEMRLRCRREGRTLLTRRRGPDLPGVFRIGADRVRDQLQELVDHLDLSLEEKGRLLSRCTVCNIHIEEISRETAEGRVPEYVFQTQEQFHICPACKRIYWHGTHPDRIHRWLQQVGGEDKLRG